jgi:hypothetical protein
MARQGLGSYFRLNRLEDTVVIMKHKLRLASVFDMILNGRSIEKAFWKEPWQVILAEEQSWFLVFCFLRCLSDDDAVVQI